MMFEAQGEYEVEKSQLSCDVRTLSDWIHLVGHRPRDVKITDATDTIFYTKTDLLGQLGNSTKQLV